MTGAEELRGSDRLMGLVRRLAIEWGLGTGVIARLVEVSTKTPDELLTVVEEQLIEIHASNETMGKRWAGTAWITQAEVFMGDAEFVKLGSWGDAWTDDELASFVSRKVAAQPVEGGDPAIKLQHERGGQTGQGLLDSKGNPLDAES